MYAACAHTRLHQPFNQSSRASRNGLLSPRKSLPIIDYEIHRFGGGANRGIQGGVPNGVLKTGDTSQRPPVGAAISAVDRAYGIKLAVRAKVCSMVKRYKVVHAFLSEVEPGPLA